MNPLQAQKKLLIVESELARVQLIGDAAALAAGVRILLDRTKSWGGMVSATAILVAGLAAFRRGRPAPTTTPPSRLQAVLKGVGVLFSLWSVLRPPPRAQPDRPSPEHR